MSTAVTTSHDHRLPLVPRWWPVLRGATLVLYVSVVVGTFGLGYHPSSYADLRNGLQDGSVTAVQIEGAMGGPTGIDPTAEGEGLVRLRWHDRWFGHYAEVNQVVHNAEESTSTTDGHDRIEGRIDTPLRRLAPKVALTWSEPPSSSYAFMNWEVPGWVMATSLTSMLGLIFTLVLGPEPRWATKWGWWWLMASGLSIVTVPPYLIVGATPTPQPRRRINGWWAFLLTLLLPEPVA